MTTLRTLVIKTICSNFLFDVDENGFVHPKKSLKGALDIDADTASSLINQLRTSRTLTKKLLKLFNDVPLVNLSLSLEFSNASPFGQRQRRDASTQFRIDDSWLDIVVEHHKNLRSLDLTKGYALTDNGIERLLEGLSADTLEHLHLTKCKRITDTPLQLLSRFTNLKSLSLGATQATHNLVISSISNLHSLTYLDLSGTALLFSLQTIADNLPKLRTLIVKATKLNDAGFAHIVKLQDLLELNASFTMITTASIAPLTTLKHLQYLDLSINAKIDESISPDIEGLTSLTTLKLSSTEVNNAALQSIANLTSLTSLDLSRTFIETAGARHLSQLTNLSDLQMAYTVIDDNAIQALKYLKLDSLNIACCRFITDEAMRDLSEMTTLRSLYVGGSGITNQTVPHLLRLTNLRSLELWETRVTYDVLVEITRALPDLQPLDERITTSSGTFIFREDEVFSEYS
eukprot:TRINITY_DN4873_c0_g3_i1.p1 TRINITY_DN4873_c0_g3~~TRINITY_DN4873_c0_g3_i1.p1  ORF type:complete len:460 (-),score=114.81 TRINITY_DN4873_c0_g3_i1:1024-2403(-)